mmetsp:Transcript_141587/g.369079  ORF Transcript_141587/g.369079 Transcript_141587/m.369079 type:complete len:217 (-) Transcript_141587:1-651(-)
MAASLTRILPAIVSNFFLAAWSSMNPLSCPRASLEPTHVRNCSEVSFDSPGGSAVCVNFCRTAVLRSSGSMLTNFPRTCTRTLPISSSSSIFRKPLPMRSNKPKSKSCLSSQEVPDHNVNTVRISKMSTNPSQSVSKSLKIVIASRLLPPKYLAKSSRVSLYKFVLFLKLSQTELIWSRVQPRMWTKSSWACSGGALPMAPRAEPRRAAEGSEGRA